MKNVQSGRSLTRQRQPERHLTPSIAGKRRETHRDHRLVRSGSFLRNGRSADPSLAGLGGGNNFEFENQTPFLAAACI